MKLYKEPYTKEYSEKYNHLYLLDEINKQHTDFELSFLEILLQDKESWLDVACGTGYHLDSVKADVEKYGVDRSSGMISYAKKNTSKSISYKTGDIKRVKLDKSFDLVSFLWMGYVHSKSVEDALSTLEKASDKVATGGKFLMSFCDPMYIFESVKEKVNMYNRGNMSFDGILWSYQDDVNKVEYKNLVAPNRFKIIEKLLPSYSKVAEIVYPKQNELYWKRSALLFEGKK